MDAETDTYDGRVTSVAPFRVVSTYTVCLITLFRVYHKYYLRENIHNGLFRFKKLTRPPIYSEGKNIINKVIHFFNQEKSCLHWKYSIEHARKFAAADTRSHYMQRNKRI
jgi:hypothetical protein